LKKFTTTPLSHSRLRWYSYRREMDDLHAGLCALPVELKELILSKIEHIEAHHILALSLTFEEAFSLLRALPRTFDFEGVEGVLADHLVNVLDDDRVRSLGKERALELLGDGNKDRLCEYACGRSFEVLQWAHNELDLPWAPCLAGRVSDEFLALRVLRETWPQLKRYWRVNVRPEEWRGVTMENGRVVKLVLVESRLTGAVPAEIGQLTSLRDLHLRGNQLTSLPEEIRQLTSLRMLSLDNNQLTRLPAGIGQLRSLEVLNLTHNQLASVPAEIGQLASLRQLSLSGSRLTRLPAEIGQLASLTELRLYRNQLTSLPAEIGQLRSLTELRLGENKLTSVPAEIGQLAALRQLSLSGNRVTSLLAEIGQLRALKKLVLNGNQLTSLPAEIGELASLTELHLYRNQLTSLPAEIGQLKALTRLDLEYNQLTSVPAVIHELSAAGCEVTL